MASLNKVLLMGNLTRDPELRYTPGSNAAVCEFGIAINRKYAQGGVEKDETCFLDIVVWGKQAESCSRYLQKGAAVFIEGRLVYDQWTEKDTQKKRSRIRVTAERVQFLNAGGRRDGIVADEIGGSMEDDPAAYAASPRQNYSRPASSAPQGRGNYQRTQYDVPPAYGNTQPQARANAPVKEAPPSIPEEDPFEDVDDIPF